VTSDLSAFCTEVLDAAKQNRLTLDLFQGLVDSHGVDASGIAEVGRALDAAAERYAAV
jgi:hypothetical protein